MLDLWSSTKTDPTIQAKQRGMGSCGSHIVHTSSTRMELEAVRQALLWLKDTSPNCRSMIIATDSLAVLTSPRNGWLPGGWHMDDSEGGIVTDSMAVLTRIRNGLLPHDWHMDDSEGCHRLHGSPNQCPEWLAAWWLTHGWQWRCHCHRHCGSPNQDPEWLADDGWHMDDSEGCHRLHGSPDQDPECPMVGTWKTVRVCAPVSPSCMSHQYPPTKLQTH